MPPERRQPKKRRFHPLRGLRRIFRKKSRGAADAGGSGSAGSRPSSSSAERGDPSANGVVGGGGNDHHLMSMIVRDREEVTLRDPSGRASDEIRSRSASELLTESSSSSCSDRDRMFLRRRGMEDSFSQLLQKGGAVVGQLSVSHDSVFPGEGSGQRARPLSSSLEMHASLERRYVKASSASPESKEPQSTQQKHRISLRVLEQIKTVIENRNQVAVAGSTATAATTTTSATSTTTATTTPDGFNSLHNRFGSRDRGERTIDNTQEKLPRKDATPSANSSILDDSGVSLKEDLPELPTGNLSHTAAHHRISVRPKNRRPPRRTTPTADATTAVPTTPTTPTTTTAPASSLTTATLLGESFAASSTSIDALDSLEEVSPTEEEEVAVPMTTTTTAASTPTTPVVVTPIVVPLAVEPSKPIPILRKSSSRISRNSDVFEELDHQKVPLRPKHQQQQTAACSPDSLESTTNLDSRSSADVLDDATKPPRPTPRSSSTSSDKSPARRSSAASNRLSKSPDSLESGSPMEWLAKSSNEGLFDMMDKEVVSAASKPVPARRSLLGPPLPVSKSQERVCSNTAGSKSDSLEALNNSDDSMERRQQHRHSSSGSIAFDLRPTRRSQHGHQHSKLMSKSTECFDTMIASAEQQQHPLLQQQSIVKIDEKRKRASCSEVNLSRGGGGGRFPAKLLSAESFEKFSAEASSDKLLLPVSLRRASGGGIVTTNNSNNNNNNNNNNGSGSSNKRMAHSSESSDNLELDDNCKLENRRRSTPKRLSRLRKNSESSELGSTDTLDSERRNHTMKSSDSDETLDSLEKDLLEPVLPVVVSSRKSKEEDELQSIQQCDNNSMVAVVERRDDNADETADTKVGAFWRRKTSSSGNQVVVESNKDEKADLDIHQLGGYLLAGNKIHENGNNDSKEDTTSPALVYAKKKQMQAMHLQQQQHQQQQQQAQQPSRGGGGGGGSEEQTKNNQLTNKSDEEVQNMLNGNISEVTTDTRSFKEKLIMFEKLGK
ncbi:DEP domain-containing protein DDB_G0279099-like isoform X3 [Trichogramma pretiosum]|uniref:DEP domain-containing protein DDB_G0279099-like isoform X3 n=1 Tax=Trichogramma pretiosum TaxID=7493 RepID=UPI0006C9A3EB|nr:DEP domain-containing protein DDB_G0279099-like isoform X3 [Trichogramma pretiosum]